MIDKRKIDGFIDRIEKGQVRPTSHHEPRTCAHGGEPIAVGECHYWDDDGIALCLMHAKETKIGRASGEPPEAEWVS